MPTPDQRNVCSALPSFHQVCSFDSNFYPNNILLFRVCSDISIAHRKPRRLQFIRKCVYVSMELCVLSFEATRANLKLDSPGACLECSMSLCCVAEKWGKWKDTGSLTTLKMKCSGKQGTQRFLFNIRFHEIDHGAARKWTSDHSLLWVIPYPLAPISHVSWQLMISNLLLFFS